MLDNVSAGILATVASLISISCAIVVHLIEESENRIKVMSRNQNNILNMTTEDISAPMSQVIQTIFFTSKLLEKYRKKMILCQPIENDRILPGTGKTHTLVAIDLVVDAKVAVPAVLDQVGDIF